MNLQTTSSKSGIQSPSQSLRAQSFYRLCFLLTVSGMMILAGCKPPAGSGSGTGVAIIDLDRVATAVGWLDLLNKDMQAADGALRQQLDQLLKASLKTIEDAKKEVSAEAKLTADQIKVLDSIQDMRDLSQLPLTAAQREKLVTVVTQANSGWQNAMNQYQQAMQSRRGNLIMGYREKLRPFIRRVAQARGFNVVLTTSDTLLLVEPAADITNDVIDELLKSPKEMVTAPITPVTTAPPAKPAK
jgi:Skp family chaperone for outer membrane proteins